jgi:hypothetical protein
MAGQVGLVDTIALKLEPCIVDYRWTRLSAIYEFKDSPASILLSLLQLVYIGYMPS